jgi:predicted Zn-dependent peptidase
LTKEELKKAKEYIKGRLVLALEDSQAVSVFYGTQELNEPATLNPDQILAKIDAVTIEDVNRVAGNYFKNNLLNFAIIGDFKDKGKFEKVLKF